MKPRTEWLSRAGIAMVLATSIGLGWGLEARLVGFAWSMAILVTLAIASPRIDPADRTTVDRLLIAIDRLDDRAKGEPSERPDDLARIGLRIRTPLVGLLGTSELLLSTDLDEAQHHYAVAIANSGAAILGMVDSIVLQLESVEPEPSAISADPRIVPENRAPAFPALDKRVLVVDDRAVNRKVAVRLFEQIGCRVEAVDDGEMGVQRAARGAFDLILMDLRMPRMDGITATRLIRRGEARSDRARAKILGFSANLTAGEHLAWTEAGMDGLILKPATRDSFYAWLTAEVTSKAGPPLAGPVFDAGKMIDRCGGDPQFAAEILASFLGSTPRSIELIREALESGDFRALADEAHGLKGTAMTIDAPRLAEAAKRLEASARSGDPDWTRDALNEVQEDWVELRITLEAAIGGLIS